MDEVNQILKFWFGRIEETIVPTENRARIWFADSPEVDAEIKTRFEPTLERAAKGAFSSWETDSHGQLALIIILDQFSRHIYRQDPRAFHQDDYALSICQRGIAHHADHGLTLMERVFYYFPLLHAEHLPYQEEGVRCYEVLMELAFPETRIIYESFFKFANHHYNIVRQFGRFPQRNAVLGRISTPEEQAYLDELEKGKGGPEKA